MQQMGEQEIHNASTHWQCVSYTMTSFLETVKDFLVGSHTPTSQTPFNNPVVWPTHKPQTECEYCDMAIARCGCRKYGVSPITEALPGILTLKAMSEWQIERMREQWEA